MSEEQETNDSTWSGLKKTIIGTIATAVTAGGAWFTSTLFGGGDDEEKPKTEQAAAAPVINLSVDNSSKNSSSSWRGNNCYQRKDNCSRKTSCTCRI
jgi:hypothetical protein